MSAKKKPKAKGVHRRSVSRVPTARLKELARLKAENDWLKSLAGQNQWTTMIPCESGWYWWRSAIGEKAVILLVKNGRVAVWEAVWGVEMLGGFWCGPVREPGAVPPA